MPQNVNEDLVVVQVAASIFGMPKGTLRAVLQQAAKISMQLFPLAHRTLRPLRQYVLLRGALSMCSITQIRHSIIDEANPHSDCLTFTHDNYWHLARRFELLPHHIAFVTRLAIESIDSDPLSQRFSVWKEVSRRKQTDCARAALDLTQSY